MIESWRQATPCGTYEVSDEGRVRTVDRYVPCTGGARLARGQILRPWLLKTGYLQVGLYGRKRVSVHRLVALAFLPIDPDRPVVNHKNGNRTDNRLENLEWVSQSENLKHAYAVLGARPSCQDKFSADHPTSKAVIAINPFTGEIRRYEAGMDAVRDGYDSSCISRCCNGQSKTHMGLRWSFAEDEQVEAFAQTELGVQFHASPRQGRAA